MADAYGAVKTKTGASERRVIAPLTWAVEYGAASGDARGLPQPLQISPRLCAGLFFEALAHNANIAPLACLRNQPKLLPELGQVTPSAGQQTPQALAAYHNAEIEKWWPVIKAANIKAE